MDWNALAPGCVEGGIARLSCLPAVFANVVNAALAFAGVVALFMIVYSGIRFVSSRGDPKAVEGARNTLTWAVIGLVVIILAYTIITIVSRFTGVGCILQFGLENCAVAP